MFSNMRIGGLASGMDIDSIVEDLMKAQRIPVQKLEQDKQILEWQQEDYREINTALRSFRDTVFNMRLQSTYLAKEASSSNESAVIASANAGAVPGTYTINITQLAQGVFKGSQSALNDETGDDGKTKKLADQFSISGTITFELEGSNGTREFSFDTSTDTIYDVVSEINDADIGIVASYDSSLNRFFLTTENTGKYEFINVISDDSNFLSGTLNLQLTSSGVEIGDPETSPDYADLPANQKGQDASFSFGDTTLTSSTNNVTINGISLELKAESSSTVTVTSDTDAVFNSIVNFIDEYNNTIETITNKLHETRYRDYKPLTDEQREQLTDDQIDKWIEKARSGLLRNDPILSSIQSKMRLTMSGMVPTGNSDYDRLADIGITTTADYMSGKLVVDEEKLREAVEEDPRGIMELFTYDSGSDEYSEMGIARRLYEDVNNTMEIISAKAGSANDFSLVDNSYIGKQIDSIEEEIDRKEERLKQIEDRYWRQFTAMEKAIQQMNQQSMWLAQQFGMGGTA